VLLRMFDLRYGFLVFFGATWIKIEIKFKS
jgi:hypothetical protein